MTSPSVISNISETDGRIKCFTIGVIFINKETNTRQPILIGPLFGGQQ